MEQFRCVKEGTGGTLQIFSTQRPWIGTYGCNTCVGVYFIVDSQRCFFAHILGLSAVTSKWHYVTAEAGKKVRDQTINLLKEFAREDDWDWKSDKFGKGLELVCPQRENSSKQYKTTGWYVMQAIHDFFISCAQSIEKELKRWDIQQESTTEFGRLADRMVFLRKQAASIRPNDKHHGFVVNPREGRIVRFGHMDRVGEVRMSDFRHFGPDPTWPYCPPELSFIVGIESDPGHNFPDHRLASREDAVKVIETLRAARARNSTDSATADRLTNRVSSV